MGELVQHVQLDGVATVRMHRPDVHNAFNEKMIAELTGVFVEVGAADDVRVVVLAGEGKSFCAGADLNWMRKMVNYAFDENVADAKALAAMLRAIADCPKPVIGRVHGAAFGGGVGLVAACDVAIAVDRASFCLSEVKLGLAPAVIAPFLVQRIGLSAARRYALSAERFGADEARRIGLVHEVVDTADELDSAVAKMCEQFKLAGPNAIAATKEILSEAARLDRDAALERMVEQIARLRVSAEGQEGLTAFLEKRDADWI